MKRLIRKRKCKHCHSLFLPDPRNIKRQKYCSRSECRKVSKAQSQRNWLNKPENQNYFKGDDNIKRVQRWRKNNPGYWRRVKPDTKNALQDPLIEKSTENEIVTDSLMKDALQDVLLAQPSVFIGIIAQLTGNTLQDDIASATRKLRQLGDDILNNPNFPERRQVCCKNTHHPPSGYAKYQKNLAG